MAYELFPGLYGGYRGRSPLDQFQRPLADMALADARAVGALSAPPPALPAGVDLRTQGWVPPAGDQGQLGSCVSWAAKHMREFLSLQAGHDLQPHSALWMYWNMRHRFEPLQQWDQDTGAFISWAAAILEGRGYALEADWSYNIANFTEQPPANSFGPALWYRNTVSVQVDTSAIGNVKSLLAAGNAFMLGFNVYQSFQNAQGSGRIPMPDPATGDQVRGGHAVFCFGYQDDEGYEGGGYALLLNQWGGWTPDDVLMMPYSYVTSQDVSDCWSVTLAAAP